MMDLGTARVEIDRIDGELASLYAKRMALSDEIAAAKRATGAGVSDPGREREVLLHVSKIAKESFPGAPDAEKSRVADGARLLFTTLFGISKARQRAALHGGSVLAKRIAEATRAAAPFPESAVVACPGADGSYAQQAVSRLFKLPSILFFPDFEKVFEAVEKGLCPYGVLPIENSAVGSVAQVYDQMLKHRFHIARAARVKVDHVLLGARGAKTSDVREVWSHPHALAQCGAFLRSLPQAKAVPAANTALAARALAAEGRKDVAVVASRACADIYGLDVIAEGIADAAYNYTRFICISRDFSVTPDASKFSIMLNLPHRPGSLNAIMSKFAAIDVNLTKLESRPEPGMDFEFRFAFDFEASPVDSGVLALLGELSQDPEIERFAFLGAYAEI